MNIIVTGAKGFIGKNLCLMLRERGYNQVIEVGRDTSRDELIRYLADADFVYHLAGSNRPKDNVEYQEDNVDFTKFIVEQLKKNSRKPALMFSSSSQATQANEYGKSKVAAELLIEQYSRDTGANHYIFRFPNVFGKWCRPNYNSFVATFCHNVLNDIDLVVHDSGAPVTLVYIDDVCAKLISLLDNYVPKGLVKVQPIYPTTVGFVADLLRAFSKKKLELKVERVGDGLERALYSTFLSYMKPEQFCYEIPKHNDERGSFCEMLKTQDSGQVSFFTAYPGVTRGGHYHHSKNEKFLVIKGKARFKFKHVILGSEYEIITDESNLKVVETAPGWSHDITNIGDNELVVMLWANEVFDIEKPDTISMPL